MNKLFLLSFRRIASRLSQQELNALTVAQALQNSKISPFGEGFLHRLPRDQLKQILNVPCPINNLEEPSSSAIVSSSKALRHHAKIDEEKTCNKCPFISSCPSAKLAFTGTMDNAPKDLLIFWSGLASLTKFDHILYRHWISAYKLGDNILAWLNDLSQGGQETQQFEKLRLEVVSFSQNKEKNKNLQQKKPKKVVQPKIQNKKAKNSQKLTTEKTLKTSIQTQEGLDFQLDEAEQFQPSISNTKGFNLEKKQQRFQPKSQKPQNNEKGYKFIEKNQSLTQASFQKPAYKKFERKDYQSINRQFENEETTTKFSYQKNDKYNNKRSDFSYQRQSKYQNKQGGYSSGNKRYDSRDGESQRKPKYQNRNSSNSDEGRSFGKYNNYNSYQNKKQDSNRYKPRQSAQRPYEQRRPYKNYQQDQDRRGQRRQQYQDRRGQRRQQNQDRRGQRRQQNQDRRGQRRQQNQDRRGQRKYQKQYSDPQNYQREQKKAKPNPFINKWTTPVQAQSYQENKTREYKQQRSNSSEPNYGFEQRRQAQQTPQQNAKARIIEAENISVQPQDQKRGGRNVRRVPRAASNADIKTTTQ